MEFRNTTDLSTARLLDLFLRHTHPYRHDALRVRVRPSRGADYSGTCFYREARIHINLSPSNQYPYALYTHVARARSNQTHWWREAYQLQVPDAEHLALFIYLHELYHFLVHAARRNPRQKEGMCDRFATRVLVDHCGCALLDANGRPAARQNWDFQDLEGFVARAPRTAPAPARAARRPIPVIIRGARWA